MGAMHPRLRCVGSVVLYLCRFLHTLMALPWGCRLQKACGGVVLLLPAAIKKTYYTKIIQETSMLYVSSTCVGHI